MTVRYILVLGALLWGCNTFAQGDGVRTSAERNLEVGMRMIGHQVLLAVGDTTSLVLPIEKEGDRYRIRFGTEFGFEPDVLTTTIDSVMRAKQISEHYIVEFVSCDSCLVVHSYGIAPFQDDDVTPCKGRVQPVSCYTLLISILDTDLSTAKATAGLVPSGNNGPGGVSYRTFAVLTLLALAILGVFVVLLKRRSVPANDLHLIRIGEFQFNKRNMELSIKNDRIKLTSKEADLLQLLCASANNTVERDDILASVWGDEGDYVGRTLDVFISKLRKKLEADANVQIVNIRGVGYKLVLGV